MKFSLLYLITDPRYCPSLPRLVLKVTKALNHGVKLIQYRNKFADQRQALKEAEKLKQLCDDFNAHLIINDDLTLAKKLQTGVHLGKSDATILQARAELTTDAIIGATCQNDLSRAQAALDQGASYVSFGAFYASQTKPEAKIADLNILRQAKKQLTCPVVAIGGITSYNAAPLLAAGADVLAVSSALLSGEDDDERAYRLFQNLTVSKSD